MAIDALNPFLTASKGLEQYQGGTPQRINPFETQVPKVGGVEGVQGTQSFGGELAEIAARGMRVNDTEIGVNQPFATTPQKQLGREGVVGADFRMLA